MQRLSISIVRVVVWSSTKKPEKVLFSPWNFLVGIHYFIKPLGYHCITIVWKITFGILQKRFLCKISSYRDFLCIRFPFHLLLAWKILFPILDAWIGCNCSQKPILPSISVQKSSFYWNLVKNWIKV